MKENRRSERVNVPINIEIKGIRQFGSNFAFNGSLVDLTPEGIRFHCIPPGDHERYLARLARVLLSFEIGGHKIASFATIVRVGPANSGIDIVAVFDVIQEEAKAAIHAAYIEFMRLQRPIY